MNTFFKGWNWKAPAHWHLIKTIDLHTAGEPLRVITEGLPDIPGDSILKKSSYFREHYDHIRTGLMWEPRGHADMYGAIITPPVTADGDFGVFFIHNEGYSTMCGHAVIALTTLVLDTGLISSGSAEPIIHIDAPPGRITARAIMKNGKVERVFFENVPSFVLHEKQALMIPGFGEITIDIAYGGAFYTFTEAEPLGLDLKSEHYNRMIEMGRKIKKATSEHFDITHPFSKDLSFLYGTIFTGKPENPMHHSRNVCIFANGEVDRSPTGTGVSARAAIHHLRGELPISKSIRIESILGTSMDVKIKEVTRFGSYEAVIPEVSASASIIGRNEFYFDPEDPLNKGFIFR